MAAIESMDICFDISDRKAFYDFRHSAVVQDPRGATSRQPNGQGTILGDCCGNYDAYELRAGQITNTHVLDKGALEKFAPSNDGQNPQLFRGTFGNEKNSLREDVLPYYLLPVYHPGEVVRGNVILSLKGKLSADKLTVNLLGLTTVNVRMYHGRGYYDNTGHETFMDETLVLWRASHVKPGGNEQFLLDKDLADGVHTFPFEFRIPESVNASIIPVVPKRDHYAFNVYRLKVTVNRGKMLRRGNSVTCRGIWIERPVNAANFRDKLSPSIAEKTMRVRGGCSSASGDIRCQVTVPRTAFARTESIPVTVDIENSTKEQIEEVSGQIRVHGRAKTGTRVISIRKSFSHSSIGYRAGPVMKNDSVNYKLTLPLDFSQSFLDSCVIPVSEASDLSKLIDFQYEVQVTVNRKRQSKDIQLAIPITICTESPGDLSAF